MIEYIILVLVGLAGGFGLGLLIKGRVAAGKIKDAEAEASKIVATAEREAETKRKEAVLEVKDKLYQARADFEKENRDKRQEIQNQERRLTQKEENLEKKVDLVEKRESDVVRRERELTAREKAAIEKEERFEKGLREQRQMLEKIASMTAEEAKRQLMTSMEDEAKHEAAKTIKRIEDEAKEEADKKSKNIISLAIQRYASDYVAEATVSVVNLPNDEMKGRIIGREGRNIRALEAATGIDLIIDDTPEAVILSCYDPLRREIARLTIERLIQDGRIHPARIEEIAEKVKKDLTRRSSSFSAGSNTGRATARTCSCIPARSLTLPASWRLNAVSTRSSRAGRACSMTWARPSTMKSRGPIPSWAAMWPRSTASQPR
jgi:ribonuclease Y